MSYKLPKLEFDRTKHVSLNEAFHILGAFMFPEEWTGLEIAAWPETTPMEIRQEKDRLMRELQLAQTRQEDLRLELYSVNEQGVYDRLSERLTELRKQADLAKCNHHEFLRGFESRYTDALAFERKQAVEAKICDAIRTLELETFVNLGTVVGSMTEWTDHERFHLSFSHSYLVSPTNLGGRYKHRAYFNKTEFDKWLAPLQERMTRFNESSLEDDFVDWFRQSVETLQAKGERQT